MTTVGQVLVTPEGGWKRYDDTDKNIVYNGKGWTHSTYPSCYNSTYAYTYDANDSVEFKFTGTKLRVMGSTYPIASADAGVELFVDGLSKGKISVKGSNIDQVLYFDVSNLNDGQHQAKLLNVASQAMYFDAIDIDENGALLPVIAGNVPLNLAAIGGDANVMLSWGAAIGATGYNIKRSTVAGGPYTMIAGNVSGTVYTDNTAVNGITYYYVVTAVTLSGESVNSNEASATPSKVVVSNTLLRIVMNDSSEREYKLTANEVAAFVAWYNRPVNTGNPSYIFTDTVDGSTEYLAFEKIISFKVLALASK